MSILFITVPQHLAEYLKPKLQHPGYYILSTYNHSQMMKLTYRAESTSKTTNIIPLLLSSAAVHSLENKRRENRGGSLTSPLFKNIHCRNYLFRVGQIAEKII